MSNFLFNLIHGNLKQILFSNFPDIMRDICQRISNLLRLKDEIQLHYPVVLELVGSNDSTG